MRSWIVRNRILASDGTPSIMGVLNVTPDSFSDGGRFLDPSVALAHTTKLIEDGADLIDIGGESSRPGSRPVATEEQLRRVLPVIEAIAPLGRPISIDTADPEVARRALTVGAMIVNDIRGLRDPEMIAVVAEAGAGAVIMHMAGSPRTMQVNPTYGDVVSEVRDWLAARVEQVIAAGIGRERLAIDPGIGFGKTAEHNQALLRKLDCLREIGCTILVGTSRKRFLGSLTGRGVGDRLVSSVVSSLAAIARGAGVVRIHDVAAMRDAWRVWNALAVEEPIG